MKTKKNFVLQEVADDFIVVPIGQEADRVRGIIKLNATGAFLWKQLTEKNLSKNELVNLLLNVYHIEKDRAETDVKAFLEQLDHLSCVEE